MSTEISNSHSLKDNFLTHVIHNSEALLPTHTPSSFTAFRNIPDFINTFHPLILERRGYIYILAGEVKCGEFKEAFLKAM